MQERIERTSTKIWTNSSDFKSPLAYIEQTENLTAIKVKMVKNFPMGNRNPYVLQFKCNAKDLGIFRQVWIMR